MPPTVTLNAHVTVAPRFHKSVNLRHDFESAHALDGYVLSPLGEDVLVRISQAIARPNGPRAFSLVGPYGSGKSAFLTLLTNLLADGPAREAAWTRLGFMPAAEGARVRAALQATAPLVPALLTGRRAHLGRALLATLRETADAYWQGRGTNPGVVQALRDADDAAGDALPDDDRIVELAVALAEQIERSSKPGRGLVLVIDEFGKFLEWAAMHPTQADVYLLQSLAEAAARSSATLALINVLHQDMAAYAGSLPRAMREEWTKVAGRFDPIPYLESPQHVVRLLSGALSTKGVEQFKAQNAIADAAKQLSGDLFHSGPPLAACFPLHPLVALALGPLFRQVGQNERSVFAFLASREPNGLAEWLSRADGSRPYDLSDLFDYVTATAPPASLTARVWTTTDHAIRRLPSDTPIEAVRLLKSIALLQLVGPSADLRADLGTLACALGLPEKLTKALIATLRGASTIVHRRFKQAYELWDGSDLDVEQLVAEHRERVLTEGGLAAQVDRTVDPAPIVASRHYLQAGTLRALPVRYVSTLRQLERQPWGTDGGLFVVLPDDPDAVTDLAQAVRDFRPPADAAPVALVLADGQGLLHEFALEYLAADSALRRTPQLEGDPIARRMLSERRSAALHALQRAHRERVSGQPDRPTEWWVAGERHPVTGRPARVASTLFDRAFHRAPQILNELVNRQDLSSAAARAQRLVMQRLIEHADEARLGIDGHPPELSIYLSLLERPGLHGTRSDGSVGLKPPVEGTALADYWAWLDAQVAQEDGGRVTFEALVERSAAPPFGVRAGTAKVLVFTWCLQRADRVFLYEENSFVPAPNVALVERLLRQPAQVELQAAELLGELADLALALQRHCFPRLKRGQGSLVLRIVARLVARIRKLSPFALQAGHVSREAAAVRAAILGARDNLRLLRTALPRAIQPDLADDALPDANRFGQGVAQALAELKAADGWLLGWIERELLNLFDRAHPGDDLAELTQLSRRAERVLRLPKLPAMTDRFAQITASFNAGDPEARGIWREGIGRAILGKAPERWRDADLDRFILRAEEQVRAFQAAERLAFQADRAGGANGVRLARLDFLDSRGEYQGQFGVVPHDAEVAGLVGRARARPAA